MLLVIKNGNVSNTINSDLALDYYNKGYDIFTEDGIKLSLEDIKKIPSQKHTFHGTRIDPSDFKN